jgi:hypothetical protein
MECACTVLYCHLSPVRLYHILPHYLINRKIFAPGGGGDVEYNFIFQLLSETRIQRYVTINIQSGRYTCEILKKLEICRQIFEKHTEVSSIMKIRSVRAELFQADGRTDMAKLTIAFRDIANAPENALSCDRQPTTPVTSVFSLYRY